LIKTLEDIAIKCELTKETLCEILIETWINSGGLLWTGIYEKSKALLLDWPIKRKLIKLENK